MRHAYVLVSWAYQVARTGACSLTDSRLCHPEAVLRGSELHLRGQKPPRGACLHLPVDRALSQQLSGPPRKAELERLSGSGEEQSPEICLFKAPTHFVLLNSRIPSLT